MEKEQKMEELPTEFAEFISLFGQVYKKTVKIKKSSIWLDHFTKIWLPFLSNFAMLDKKDKSYKLLDSSLLLIRFLGLMKRFRWLQLCIWLGAYHPLMRELRFALESCIQAYYVDKEYPDAKLDYKFEALEEIENQRLIGTKLIYATDLQNKNEMKDIYFYLSKYTHSSPVELNEIKNIMLQESLVVFDLFDTVSNFAFNADLFHKAEELTNKTMDVVYYVCLSLFPEVRKKLKQEENVINSLKELNCTISKNYIEKIGE